MLLYFLLGNVEPLHAPSGTASFERVIPLSLQSGKRGEHLSPVAKDPRSPSPLLVPRRFLKNKSGERLEYATMTGFYPDTNFGIVVFHCAKLNL